MDTLPPPQQQQEKKQSSQRHRWRFPTWKAWNKRRSQTNSSYSSQSSGSGSSRTTSRWPKRTSPRTSAAILQLKLKLTKQNRLQWPPQLQLPHQGMTQARCPQLPLAVVEVPAALPAVPHARPPGLVAIHRQHLVAQQHLVPSSLRLAWTSESLVREVREVREELWRLLTLQPLC
jgi:hypothetical protein